MKSFLKTAIVLCAICAVAAVLLALVNKATAPAIKRYEDSVVMNALEEVSAGYEIGARFEVSDTEYVSYCHKLEEGGVVKGYLLGLVSKGYGGEMTLVASYKLDGVLLAAKLVANSETPGLGKKAENPSYMDKYVGHGTDADPIPVSKSMLSSADSAAVSGASMTFNGISKALSAGSEFVKGLK